MPRTLQKAAFFFLLVFGTAANAAASERVPLVVSDPAGLKQDWPLVGGVPFPKSTLKSTDRLRLVDGTGNEVPAQIDRTATWKDGSVRWAMVSAVAPPSGEYFLEFGLGVRRSSVVDGLSVERSDSGYTVHTGTARFSLRTDGLGVDCASLKGAERLWLEGARGLYAIDSRGRRAVCGGPNADVRWSVAVNGPARAVLRGDAHYVTEDGERVARATVWYAFFRGLSDVKVVHTFYLTRDTDKLWFREIGFDVPFRTRATARVTFDVSKEHDAEAYRADLVTGETLYAYQDDYPHFLDTRSHFSIHRVRGGNDEELHAGEALGEWLDLADGKRGLTVAVRDLAEQFPKELAVSAEGITVKLWSSRDGRELDFRMKKLVPNFFGKWIEAFKPEAQARFRSQPSNALGSAKTHEFRLRPYAGASDTGAAARWAHAADERVILLPDPKWTCASGALGAAPMQEKDAHRFPEAEAMMSEFFDRVLIPNRAFPATGFIGWGCHPFMRFRRTPDGRWYADFYRLAALVEYNLRRSAWLMFARSGERKYYDYVCRFDWFAADWNMHHEDFRRKLRGGFAINYMHYPVFWGDASELFHATSSGTDLCNWYLDYYMTGDLRSLEMTHEYRDAVLRHFEDAMAKRKYTESSPFLTLRMLVQVYMESWDERLGRIAREWAHRILDPESPNGLTDNMPYGCTYKVTRNLVSTLEYWRATGDPLAKECYLKAVEYHRRFAWVRHPISYQNGQAAEFTMAYLWTGDPRWLRLAHVVYQVGLEQFEAGPKLAEELEPGLDRLSRLPLRQAAHSLHVFYSMPVFMKALGEYREPVRPASLVPLAWSDTEAWVVLRKKAGKSCYVELCYPAVFGEDLTPVVVGPKGKEADGVAIEAEPVHSWKGPSRVGGRILDRKTKPGQLTSTSARVTFAAGMPAGDYRLGPRKKSSRNGIAVVGSDADRLVVEGSDGLFLDRKGIYSREQYFKIPRSARTVELFCSRPVIVKRSDGSVAIDGTRKGALSVPVKGKAGFWSVTAQHQAFFRLKGIPNVLAAAPELYFEPSKLRPPSSRPVRIAASEKFVPGPVGRARHLPGGSTLSFDRGASRADGFDNIPGEEGTIEVLFRPSWSSRELTFDGNLVHRVLVGSKNGGLFYRYGEGPMKGRSYAFMSLLIPGAGRGYGAHFGTACRLHFQEGRWYHWAATWKITRRNKLATGEFALFLDGKKMPRDWSYPKELSARPSFTLREWPRKIAIGPMDGTIDELRISDVVRYEADFTPASGPFEPDAHTTALFHFENTDEPYLRGRNK